MSYGLSQYIPANPATGLIVGQEVSAWIGSRFSPVNTPPATNGSPPSGSPDYGPTATTSISGCAFTVTTTDEFILSVYDPADTSNGGSYNTYWYGPYLIDPSTNLKGWTAAVDQTSNRNLTHTTVASGSNGAVLPQTSISVVSTAPGNPGSFSGGGILFIQTTSPNTWTAVSYGGVSGGNTFTGCSGGSGTLATNQLVIQAFQAGNYRRIVTLNLAFQVVTSGDAATAFAVSTLGGNVFRATTFGIANYNATTQMILDGASTFEVDPLGYYGVYPALAGTGNIAYPGGVNGNWVEVDV